MNGETPVRAFVQARMRSARFPGKVLAPLAGRPLVDHVIDAVSAAVGAENVVVVTSEDPSDEPLATYLERRGVVCFRGPLDDVLGRFRLAAEAYPAKWVVRVCADSPLLDPADVRAVVAAADGSDADLVTTRTADGSPHGRNAEAIRVAALRGLPDDELTDDDREHVTAFFYRERDRFTIREVALGPGPFAGEPLTVDTVEDLRRLERLL